MVSALTAKEKLFVRLTVVKLKSQNKKFVPKGDFKNAIVSANGIPTDEISNFVTN